MVDKTKIINFIQDFGCCKIEHIQILFNCKNDNIKNILNNNMISRKGDILVHNTQKINNNMIIALDILCKFKNRLLKYYKNYEPIYISFLNKDNLLYHIIVSDTDNQKGIVKLINAYPLTIPKADKLVLAFPNNQELENINCDIPFIFTTYPDFEILNS